MLCLAGPRNYSITFGYNYYLKLKDRIQTNLHFTGFSTDAPESSKSMSGLQATLIMKRDGDTLKQKTVMGPGIELDVTIKLNEVLDWKDKEENPNFHVKVYYKYINWSK